MNCRLFFIFAFGLTLSGCAQVATKPGDLKPNVPIDAQPKEITEIQSSQPIKNDLSDSGSDLNAIPMEVNRTVLYWIDYFQGPGRPHMERYLSRSTRYMPLMKQILRQNGLPEDLVYIALIESGFSSTARSTAKAVGYWQFIKGTGKRYGLQIDNFVDERRDFARSTEAAADYFKGLYNLFGAWYLAIASYNVGENRVKNLVMKYKTRDFWQLARENKLPQETVHYVPKFLAARLIAKNPEKYGFNDIEYMPALAYKEVEVRSGLDLKKVAERLGVDYDDIRDLNPSFKRGVTITKRASIKLRVPAGLEDKVAGVVPIAVASPSASYVNPDEDYTYYRVRRGETLSSIAKRFGISLSQLQKLNNLKATSMIVAGKRIRIPGEVIVNPGRSEKKEGDDQSVAGDKKGGRTPSSKKKQSATNDSPNRIHIVRRGETLFNIARKYRVGMSSLTHANRLPRRARVQVGMHLVIPR